MPFCETHFRTYPVEHEGCVTCYQDRAKTERTTARTQDKQAKDIAKQRERAKGSKTAVKQVSKKQAQEATELSRIKKELIEQGGKCIACNTSYDLTLSHVISRRHKQYSTNPLNLVLLCLDCHRIWEIDRAYFRILYPSAFNEKLARAKLISEEHYQKILSV